MQYVYLIQCQQFYKIGIANDVESRLAQLSTGNPFPLEVLAVYGFDNAGPIEASLHQRFANSRKRGEWFELCRTDIDDFNSVCELLGGNFGVMDDGLPTVEEAEIEEAEHSAESEDGGKWDYAAMFADGWRMEPSSSRGKNGVYWAWRKAENGKRPYIYGGVIAELPYPLHEMKNHFALGTITNTEAK